MWSATKKLRITSMTSVSPDLRRLAAALLISCPLAGCSVFSGTDVNSIYDFSKRIILPQRVRLQDAAATPYASLGLRVGRSSEIMLVLATDSNGERLWTSAARIAITTSAGRVIRTSGLGQDLGGLALQSRVSDDKGATTSHWLADLPDLNAYGVTVVCQSRPSGDETIKILGATIQTRRVDEDCRCGTNSFLWTFENVYWIDPTDGMVWRSIQHVNPKLDALEIEILRPPTQ